MPEKLWALGAPSAAPVYWKIQLPRYTTTFHFTIIVRTASVRLIMRGNHLAKKLLSLQP